MKNESLFKGATLLSIKEAEQVPESIRAFCGWWWLRSPGDYAGDAAYVDRYGRVCKNGSHVSNRDACVRPALQLESNISNLKDGDRIKVGKWEFDIVCNGEYALCTTSIRESVFREDYKAKDVNVYDASDIKKVVDKWFTNEIKGKDISLIKIIRTETKIGVA